MKLTTCCNSSHLHVRFECAQFSRIIYRRMHLTRLRSSHKLLKSHELFMDHSASSLLCLLIWCNANIVARDAERDLTSFRRDKIRKFLLGWSQWFFFFLSLTNWFVYLVSHPTLFSLKLSKPDRKCLIIWADFIALTQPVHSSQNLLCTMAWRLHESGN